VLSDRTRGNGHKLKTRRFLPNIRRNPFIVRVTEHWHRIPSEAVEFSSLDIFPDNQLQVAPLQQGGLDKMSSRGPFQPSLFYDSAQLDSIPRLSPPH